MCGLLFVHSVVFVQGPEGSEVSSAFDALEHSGVAAGDPVRRQLSRILKILPTLQTLVRPWLGVRLLVLHEVRAVDEVFSALLTAVYGPAGVVEAFRRGVGETVGTLRRRRCRKNEISCVSIIGGRQQVWLFGVTLLQFISICFLFSIAVSEG